MKINFTKSVLAAALVLLLASCGKEDSDTFIPGPVISGADTNWVTTITAASPVQEMKQLLGFFPRTDSCEASTNTMLQFSDGLQISIPANAAMIPGGPLATGRIQVEAMLIRKKGDLIKLDRPTVSNGRQLVTAGEVFVSLKKNGNDLMLAPGKKIGIKFSDVLNSNILPRAFKGEEGNVERFNWVETQDTITFGTQGSTHCEFNTTNLRWSGIHSYADTSGNRVTIHVSMPVNFTNGNTMVYLVFKDVKSVLGIYGSATTKKFISGKVQSGKLATVVVISKQGPNSFYLYHDNITTGLNTGGALNQVVLAQPQPTSLTDIRAYLETL